MKAIFSLGLKGKKSFFRTLCILCTMLVFSGRLAAQDVGITGVLTADNLTVTGTIQGGTFSGTLGSGTLANITSLANLTNLTVTNLNATNIAGTLTTVAQPNITTMLGLTTLTSTGIVTVGTLSATTLSGTLMTASQPNITTLSGLSTLTTTGTITVGTLSATTLYGTLMTAAQPYITTLNGLTTLTSTGAVSVGRMTATNLAVSSNLTVTGVLSAATLSGTLNSASASQPNITSVGTLTSLTVNGLANADNINLGFTTTVSSGGTLQLSSVSDYIQEITGTNSHTINLPVTSGLVLGQSFFILNNSTGTVTVNTSAGSGNVVKVLPANSQVLVTVVATSGTTAASWSQSASYSYNTGGGIGSMLTSTAGINTTETVIVSSVPLSADRLLVGTVFRITLEGTATATAGRVPTFRIRIGNLGTTADGIMVTSTLPASPASGTGIPFKVVTDVTVRTVGAAASVSGMTTVYNNGSGGLSISPLQVVLPSFTNFNSTTSGNIISATFSSAASATLTCTFTNAYIEVIYK